MDHNVLYNAARPRKFADVVGQGQVIDTITSTIVSDTLPPSILLSGHYGCGKTTTARLIAAAVNCEYREEGSPEPCGGSNPECMTCEGTLTGGATMGAVTELDAASSRSIDTIRELIESMTVQVAARKRVYIIDEAHQLSKDAVSALLKTLEEPPPNVVIIMATTDPDRLPDTIRSRMTHFPLSAMSDEGLRTVVTEAASAAGIELDEATVASIVARSNNSARDALNLVEHYRNGTPVDAPSMVDFASQVVTAVGQDDPAGVIVSINTQIAAGARAAALLSTVTQFVRHAVAVRQAPDFVPEVWREAAAEVAETLGARLLSELMSALLQAHRSSVSDARLGLESALLDVVMRNRLARESAVGATVDVDAVADAVVERLRPLLAGLAAAADPTVSDARRAGRDKVDETVSVREAVDEDDDLDAGEVAAAIVSVEADAIEPKGRGEDGERDDDAQSSATIREVSLDDIFQEMCEDVSRRGRLILDDEDARLSRDDGDSKILVLQVPRGLADEDWHRVVGVARSYGFEIEEEVLARR